MLPCHFFPNTAVVVVGTCSMESSTVRFFTAIPTSPLADRHGKACGILYTAEMVICSAVCLARLQGLPFRGSAVLIIIAVIHVYRCVCTLFLRRAALRRPRVLSRTFGCGASKWAVVTLRRMSGSRPSTVAMLGAFKVAELVLLNKGLLSASPSRVGNMENPTFFFPNLL